MKTFAALLFLVSCLTVPQMILAQGLISNSQINVVPNPGNEDQPATVTVTGLPPEVNTVNLVYDTVPGFFLNSPETVLPMASGGGNWSVTINPSAFGNYGFEFQIVAEGTDTTLESDDLPLTVQISDFATITQNSLFPNDPEAGLWHSVSLPFVSNISLVATLGNQDISPDNGLPLNWSAYRWDAVADSLVSVSSFVHGIGYFLYHDDQFDIGLEVGGDAVSSQEDAFEGDNVLLHSGWNLIPWPFTFSVAYERDNDNGADSEISDLWQMSNGGWSKPGLFQPYGAYAVFNKKAQDTALVTEDGSLLVFTQVFLSKDGDAPRVWDERADWQIRFMAKTGPFEDAFNFIGVSPGSDAGVDNRDEPEPPRIGKGIRLAFPAESGFLSSDIRNSGDRGHVWNMSFDAARSTKTAELAWEKNKFPGGMAAFLVDITNNTIVDLNAVSSYSFSVQETNLFKVVAGDIAYADQALSEIKMLLPERFSVAQNYPNPFNPSTKIQFDLAAAGDARMVVYNMLGQEVATLVNGFRQTGHHETVWNGRDGFGNQVASGVYFYRLVVRNDSGTGFSKAKKMILVR